MSHLFLFSLSYLFMILQSCPHNSTPVGTLLKDNQQLQSCLHGSTQDLRSLDRWTKLPSCLHGSTLVLFVQVLLLSLPSCLHGSTQTSLTAYCFNHTSKLPTRQYTPCICCLACACSSKLPTRQYTSFSISP